MIEHLKMEGRMNSLVAVIIMVAIVYGIIWLWMKLKSTALLVLGVVFMALGVFIFAQPYSSQNTEIEALLSMIAGMIGIGSSAIISEVGRAKKAVEKKED